MIKSISDVAVTATPQRMDFPEPRKTYTLENTDATNSIMFIHDPATIKPGDVTTFVGATVAVIQALGGTELAAGKRIVIRDAPPWLHVVCISTKTATLQVYAGEIVTAD